MINIKCKQCGRDIKIYPYEQNKNNFCSKDCYYNFLKKPNEIIRKDYFAEIILRTRTNKTFIALIDIDDIEKISKYSWAIHCNKYIRNTEKIFIHRLIMDCPKDKVVDHINHNPLDNRKSNLRICTIFGNNQNNINTKTGKSGVSYSKIMNKWHARIKIENKNIHLGYFDNIDEAIKV